ncbi:hypothetical protein DM860_014659 [Cuscuta australis]|uniref:Uncharacterized protein n=1 Tax=Cuscuta australis TaxID=267555 RepID=A0A328DLP6_9ASTE|nr:hypothetical protein DM860_014659 [Cuscuta australis]
MGFTPSMETTDPGTKWRNARVLRVRKNGSSSSLIFPITLQYPLSRLYPNNGIIQLQYDDYMSKSYKERASYDQL